jgi:hypothetical protein
MDMNNTPEPRMPLVENLEFLDLMGVISSPCKTVANGCGVMSSGKFFASLCVRGRWLEIEEDRNVQSIGQYSAADLDHRLAPAPGMAHRFARH